MIQLDNKSLNKILQSLKEQRWRDRTSEKETDQLIARLSRLRRNLFVSGGTVSIFLLSGLTIQTINFGSVQGEIKYPLVIPVALALIFLYYFRLYTLHLQWLKNTISYNDELRSNYHQEIAQNIALQSYTESIEKGDVAEKGVPCPISSFLQIADDKPDRLTFDVKIQEGKCIQKDSLEIAKNLPGFEIDHRGKLIFRYNLTDHDKTWFANNIAFFKKMNKIKLMDYQLPRMFGFIITCIIVVYLILWLTCEIQLILYPICTQ
ncbi:MAG: hypothetical protein RIC06_00845 [Cyclobacteriaceae bacterium]